MKLKLLLILLLASQICCVSGTDVKNVILLIGDGMGFPQMHVTKIVHKNLTMEGFNWTFVGYELTDSLSGEVPDSAAAGTAIATGFKTYNGMVSTLALNNRTINLTTVLEVAKRINKSTGLVTTTKLSDATPAVFASHVESRKLKHEILEQMISKVDVLLGGGAKEFDLLKKAESCGYEIVYDKRSLENVKCKKLIGLFSQSHIPYVLDRDNNTPSLLDMTKKAIEILSKNENGFFLMVEGSRIDDACHTNDIASVVAETKEFDDVVRYAVNYAKKGDTLVVVLADHDTGGLAIGTKLGSSVDVKEILRVNKSVESMAEEVKSGIDVKTVLLKYAGFIPNKDELQKIEKSRGIKYGLVNSIGEIIAKRVGVKFATHEHTGNPVPLMIYSPKKFDFKKFVHHTETSKEIVNAMLFNLTIAKADIVLSKVKGDVNGNHIVDKEDAYIILAHVGEKGYENADMNENGVIDYEYVLLII